MFHSDPLAERMLLALGLSGHPSVTERFLRLPLEVFTAGRHQAVAGALRDAMTRDDVIHPPNIAAEASRRTDTRHKAELISQLVVNLVTEHPPVEAFDFYAETVRRMDKLRRATEIGERLWRMTDTDDLDIGATTHALRTLSDDLDTLEGVTAVEPPISLQALMDEPTEPYDWLVPGLLERQDRLVITAGEGLGKSVLLAQFATALGAGLHPFAGEPLPDNGFRVLVLDCENPRGKVTRRYREVRAAVDQVRQERDMAPVDWSTMVRFELHPGGIDLTDPREFAVIEQRVAATAPDLVVAGPLYQMHRTDTNDETAARALVAALDRLRVRYNFALICEAHAPHGGDANGGRRKLRPAGSSLFLRWPEFGYGLRPMAETGEDERPSTVELVPWRGDRDQRLWPHFLSHGGDGCLPWKPADASYWRKTFRAVN